jgi:hypothetical protein
MARKRKIKPRIRYDLKIISWCMDNGYKLYPVPEGKQYRVVLEYKGMKKKSELLYTKKQWSERIWEVYGLIYDKQCQEKK